MFNRILVAVAPTITDPLVINEALELAKCGNANVLLLHVLSPIDESYPTPIYPGPDSVYPALHEEAISNFTRQWQHYERQGLDYLDSLVEQASQSGVTPESKQVIGDPGKAICRLATEWKADLIVLGRRGYTGLQEFLLGSVSNYVLHHAPCSVLTVQGE